MPICKRDGFDSAKNENEAFQDDDEVFFCETTKEIFRDYEDYFRHIMTINSTVWTCEETGREGLTYNEARKSEIRARRKIESFKDVLRPPTMLVIEHAKQSSVNTLSAMIYKLLRYRYFKNEEVQACSGQSTYYSSYTVIDVLGTNFPTPPANGVYEDTEKILYKLRKNDTSKAEVTLPWNLIRRSRLELNNENLLMFIKKHIKRIDGLLTADPQSYKKYVTDRNVTFDSVFLGKLPFFEPSKVKTKRPQAAGGASKKQTTINKYLVKSNEEKQAQVIAEAMALKEKLEQMQRQRQEQQLEQERLKLEKRAKLMERVEAQCNELLTKTDDLERTDQRLLPTFSPVKTFIPDKLLSDAFMCREFMTTYRGLLSGMEVFRNAISFYEISRAFTMREVVGPLSDILLIMLGTIFDLQKEEEDECPVNYFHRCLAPREPYITMTQAGLVHLYAKRHFSFKLNELPIDALTISEVVRLHLLSSGAMVHDRADKWRIMYRNGYTSSEDPGLSLRMRHPHILRALKMYTIYQLPFRDIIRIVNCLMAQILTYSNALNIIEERMESTAKARMDLRNLTTAENRRQSNSQQQRKALIIDHNQQCLTDEVKGDEEKKAHLAEKLNKKVAELLAQSERERGKYQKQLHQLHGALFNYLVLLGMDRAYRKYYVLESMPGIFVEHAPECYDVCLQNPPQNAPSRFNLADLPKNRKDLRNYLVRLYTEEEKKSKQKNKEPFFENKENHANALPNGLTNGHDSNLTNGVMGEVGKINGNEAKVDEIAAAPAAPPTQYELFMCTGDPQNCIVHDERNKDRQRWSYLYKEEDIQALIDQLNPLGDRESQLRDQLTLLFPLIVEHTRKCPVDQLTLEDNEKIFARFKATMLAETQRNYSKANFGWAENADLNEVVHTALIERILQFENDIYSGDLGRLKVKDMVKWRQDLVDYKYDAQGKLQWGPTTGTEMEVDEGDEDANDDDDKDNGNTLYQQYAGKPYSDPGDSLGNTLEIDSEDSADDEISLHDSNEMRSKVVQMASALLQVEQAIERRFIKEPFGVTVKSNKNADLVKRNLRLGEERLKQWELSLMECTSFSQVFLHLNILHDSIMWRRSTNKSLCTICRRGSEPNKMLLCDECNGGTHMFCMKPKMRSVPAGNWYCHRCVNLLGKVNTVENEKKRAVKKRSVFVDEDNEEPPSPPIAKKNGRGRGSRGAAKQMRQEEIEEILEDEEESEEEVEEAEAEEEAESVEGQEGEEEEEVQERETEENDEAKEDAASEESEEDEDSNVCIVCSYDGADIHCSRCKDTFHLECLQMKRVSRYTFVCTKCKKAEKLPKAAPKEESLAEDSEESDDSEPLAKRSRKIREARRRSSTGPSTSTNKTSGRRSNRRTGDHLPLNSSALYELLDEAMKHELAWPFLRPVSLAEVPDYFEIIKSPMDLAKVKSNLNMGKYQLNEEVMKDIQLIFNNCDEYNVMDNEIYKAGAELEKFIIQRAKQLNLPFQPSDMNK